jgi:amidase
MQSCPRFWGDAMTIGLDSAGALCKSNRIELKGSGAGPLAGCRFAAKDVFHIAGAGTGFGHPEWLATHEVPATTAPAVQKLLEAGADLMGKAQSDELCYSLSGENRHYGTPENAAAPGRIPGGSSSGSAAAVAAGLCDFALGTDCGGSVRIPASYCGLLGIRPGLGQVSAEGVLEFAPAFDVVGWFAKTGELMRRVGDVLLPERCEPVPLNRILIASDAFAYAALDVNDALAPAVDRVASHFKEGGEVTVSPEGLEPWYETFRTIQGFEVWRSLGGWVRDVNPKLGDGVRERLSWASTVTSGMYAAAMAKRLQIMKRLEELLPPGTALCLPTAPRVAPPRNMPASFTELEYRTQAMQILCIAGLSGLPQITLPLASLNGLPLGVSVIGWRSSEFELLSLAEHLCR